VTINYKGWDTHRQHFQIMRRKLPELDRGLAALLGDLSSRGLLDTTIVWAGGEFGRTPKVLMEPPWNGGRNHFGAVYSTLIAGGGLKGGQVVGASDARGEEVKDRPVHPREIIGSMYELLGIDPNAKLRTPRAPTSAPCRRSPRRAPRFPAHRTHVNTARPVTLSRSSWCALAAFVAAAFTAVAAAQIPGQRLPHIGFVYPAGAQQGTTVKICVGGQNLVGANTVYLSSPELFAKIVGYERPITQQEFQNAREQLQKLQDNAPHRARDRATRNPPRRRPGPPPMRRSWRNCVARSPIRQPAGESVDCRDVTIEVTVPRSARPANTSCASRAATVSPTRWRFTSGNSGIHRARDEAHDAARRVGRTTGLGPVRIKRGARSHDPGDRQRPGAAGEVDRVRFAGKKGQKLTFGVSARALIPYLATRCGLVPAHAGAVRREGSRAQLCDDYRSNPDPVLLYELPGDGDYVVEIKDSIFRGREDFVYRIAIGELPFVTSIYPLGSPPMQRATFALTGWNLASSQLTMDTIGRGIGVYLLSVRNEGFLSNQVRFAVDPDPAAEETEPNNAREAAQAVLSPQVINGRIEKPGDVDVFRFSGRSGEAIVAEVFARRLNSPLDSTLELTDAAGQRIAFNDDNEDKRSARDTHHADSRISATLPADGVYFLTLRDTQASGASNTAIGCDSARRDRITNCAWCLLDQRAPRQPRAAHGLRAAARRLRRRDRARFQGRARRVCTERRRIPAGLDKVALTLAVPRGIQGETAAARPRGSRHDRRKDGHALRGAGRTWSRPSRIIITSCRHASSW